MTKFIFLFFLLFAVCFDHSLADTAIPLKLVRCLPVDGPENSQPSGLAIWNNTLVTISDKHDSTIFRIDITGDTATLRPLISFTIPDTMLTKKKLDFEGITCDGSGTFYLASEKYYRVLRVGAQGKDISWASPCLEAVGKKAGLFQVRNANLEGIALVESGKFVLCAERQPRGLILVDMNQVPPKIDASTCDQTRFIFPEKTSPDFSDVCFFKKTLYALQRNAYLISPMILIDGEWEEGTGWTYQAIVTNDKWRYADMRYGHAEGLCMNHRFIYVILDNNGDCRTSDPKDNRPLLLILENPLN